MTVWIYVDTSKQVGDAEHLKVFANPELADEWFKRFDPEAVAFEYPIIGDQRIIFDNLQVRMVCSVCGHKGADMRPEWGSMGSRTLR